MLNLDEIQDKARRIKCFLFDVDGILTDGRIVYHYPEGESKSFHVRDGHGIVMAQQCEFEVAFITGRKSLVIERRAEELGVKHVYQDVHDKLAVFQELKEKLQLPEQAFLYAGDDLMDLPLLDRVGLSVSVPDAPVTVRTFVDMVTELPGGQGAVREMIDFVLQTQGYLNLLINELLP